MRKYFPGILVWRKNIQCSVDVELDPFCHRYGLPKREVRNCRRRFISQRLRIEVPEEFGAEAVDAYGGEMFGRLEARKLLLILLAMLTLGQR